MSLSRVLWVGPVWALFAACNPPPLQGPGGPCHSLTDCQASLVCDRGKCTGDLSGLSRQTQDPPFLMFGDAGSEAGIAVPDAGVAVPDAGVAVPDAGVTAPDAGGPTPADAATPAEAGVTPPTIDAGGGTPTADGG